MDFTNRSPISSPFNCDRYRLHGLVIRRRLDNGMVSLTDIAAPYDFNLASWLNLAGTRAFLRAVKASFPEAPELILAINGGRNTHVRGTWGTIVIARRFLQHVDPFLAIACDDVISRHEHSPEDPLRVIANPDRSPEFRDDPHPYRSFQTKDPSPPLSPH